MNGADKKSGPVVLVIDYGASNLRSVQKAFAKLGYEARCRGMRGISQQQMRWCCPVRARQSLPWKG